MNLDSRKYHFRTGFALALIIVFILSLYNACFATAGDGIANFSWLPNTESDLAGYKIHYGINPNGPYDSVVDAGNPPPVDGRIKGSVSGLTEGVTYYFVATAYNTSGLESEFSSEVTYTCPSTNQPDTTPPAGTIVIAAGSASTLIQNVTLTLSASDTEGTVTEMKFSNDSVNWSNSELYNTSKNWILTDGAGTKTVYVQFKDNADNWSSSYSDSIELIASSQPITTPTLRIKSIGELHY